jgi:quercetin dioxygenase-like cupin family protein
VDRFVEIRPGDVLWFSLGEKHWHGATPTKVVDWMDKGDEQYRK